MKKQDSQQRVGVGVSSVLMILVVLAMTALSLLALGSARSNESMTSRNATVSAAYYVAADQVQRQLADIDATILQGQAESADLFWFEMQGLDEVTWTEEEVGITFRFSVDTGEGHTIAVTGVLTGEAFPRYKLTEHRLINNDDLQEDTYLVLMGE
ncbi:MAG: hypothetical protein E7319_04015 [Clostridiales bacterium]|nr:hypothetical protein [Clostridiales bacterium]